MLKCPIIDVKPNAAIIQIRHEFWEKERKFDEEELSKIDFKQSGFVVVGSGRKIKTIWDKIPLTIKQELELQRDSLSNLITSLFQSTLISEVIFRNMSKKDIFDPIKNIGAIGWMDMATNNVQLGITKLFDQPSDFFNLNRLRNKIVSSFSEEDKGDIIKRLEALNSLNIDVEKIDKAARDYRNAKAAHSLESRKVIMMATITGAKEILRYCYFFYELVFDCTYDFGRFFCEDGLNDFATRDYEYSSEFLQSLNIPTKSTAERL